MDEAVARMGQMRNAYKRFLGKPEGKIAVGKPTVDGRIILEWILGNRVGSCGLGSSGSGQGQVAGCCEHGKEPSGSIKSDEFLTS
jgi:hypothetical protein